MRTLKLRETLTRWESGHLSQFEAAETVGSTDVRNDIAIAEPYDVGATWWIGFPGFPGVTSAAGRPEQIAALASAVDADAPLPRAIEDADIPAYDLDEYSNPQVLLVACAAPVAASAD